MTEFTVLGSLTTACIFLLGFLTSPGPILCPLSVSPVSCPTLIPVIPGFIPHLSCLQPCLVTPLRPIILIPLVHSIGFLCITEFIHSFLSKTFTFCLAFTLSFVFPLHLITLFPSPLPFPLLSGQLAEMWQNFWHLKHLTFVKSASHMLAPCFLLRISCTDALGFLLHPNSTPITIASCHVIVLRCTLRLIS